MPDPVIPVCDVSVRMYRQDGLADVGARVTATLNTYEVYNGYVVPRTMIGTTDADGLCVLSLFPNELGSVESSYTVKLTGTNGKTQAVIAVVPNVGSADLENIAVLPPFPGKVDGQLALEAVLVVGEVAQQAAQDALNAQNSAETAALNSASSAVAASNSETAAGDSETAAAASASAADASADAAAASEAAAAASASAADASADAAAAEAASISPSTIVRTTGDQTVGGIKTFSSSPIVPTPTTATQAANKDYADTKVARTSATGSAVMPSGTTAQRDGAGNFRLNSTLGCMEFTLDGGTTWIPTGWQFVTPLSASGSAVDFTGIPSIAKQIRVGFIGVSADSGANFIFQLGDSGGIETTGYVTHSASFATSTIAGSQSSSSFSFSAALAGGNYSGFIDFQLIDPATNTWAALGNFARDGSSPANYIAGIKALSGTLDRIRVALSAAGALDAGTIPLLWRA